MRRIRRAAVGVALVLAALAAGVVAGTAAAGSAGPNGSAGKGTVIVPFSKTTPLEVKAAAVVNPDGTLVRGSKLPYSVASTVRIGTGVYDVRFNGKISGCAWFGNVGLGGFGGSTGPATITISGRAGTNNGLFITTFDGAGSPVDEPFMVQVVC